MKSGKVAGSSNILPEMLKIGYDNGEFFSVVEAAWEEKCVSQEWVDTNLVPISKKGNLPCCNNGRGIEYNG